MLSTVPKLLDEQAFSRAHSLIGQCLHWLEISRCSQLGTIDDGSNGLPQICFRFAGFLGQFWTTAPCAATFSIMVWELACRR